MYTYLHTGCSLMLHYIGFCKILNFYAYILKSNTVVIHMDLTKLCAYHFLLPMILIFCFIKYEYCVTSEYIIE